MLFCVCVCYQLSCRMSCYVISAIPQTTTTETKQKNAERDYEQHGKERPSISLPSFSVDNLCATVDAAMNESLLLLLVFPFSFFFLVFLFFASPISDQFHFHHFQYVFFFSFERMRWWEENIFLFYFVLLSTDLKKKEKMMTDWDETS